MQQYFFIVALLISNILFSACSTTEKPRKPIVHIASDLKIASVHVDGTEVGNLSDGKISMTLEIGRASCR